MNICATLPIQISLGNIMKDDNKTKKQLIIELSELRSQNAALKETSNGNIAAQLVNQEDTRYAESIVETIREPLLVLDANLKIISANRNFYTTFKVNPGETIGNFIYDLGNKQWDIPKLRKLLENILPKNEVFNNFEVAHNFQNIGYKVMLINARQIYRKDIDSKIILLAIEDITERKRLENLLTESEARYRHLFETSSDGIVFLEQSEGKITHANPASEKMLGYTKKEIIGNKLQDIGVSLDMGDFQTTIQNLNRIGIINYSNVPVTTKSGQQIYTDIYLVDRAILVQCSIRDITERNQTEEALQESEARLRDVLSNSPDVSYKRNLQTDSYDYLSPSFAKNYGYDIDEMKNLPMESLMTLIHPDDLPELGRVIAASNSDAVGTESQMKYRFRQKDGTYRWLHDQFTVMRDADGTPLAIIGSVRDITKQKQVEEALVKSEERYHELSIIDGLTHLYNSRHFYLQLKSEIERSNRHGQPLTLLLLDLDNFKAFNDTYGHIEGDQVLLRLGQVIKRCLRQTDSAYRYGGEEFTILLPMTTSNDAAVTAERIRTEFKKEIFSPAPGQDIHMTVSIGLAQYKTKEEMKVFVNRVDQLMYQAKNSGKDRVCSEA